jgi:hypothetical protein
MVLSDLFLVFTQVGSKAITLRQATVVSGVVDPAAVTPEIVVGTGAAGTTLPYSTSWFFRYCR